MSLLVTSPSASDTSPVVPERVTGTGTPGALALMLPGLFAAASAVLLRTRKAVPGTCSSPDGNTSARVTFLVTPSGRENDNRNVMTSPIATGGFVLAFASPGSVEFSEVAATTLFAVVLGTLAVALAFAVVVRCSGTAPDCESPVTEAGLTYEEPVTTSARTRAVNVKVRDAPAGIGPPL